MGGGFSSSVRAPLYLAAKIAPTQALPATSDRVNILGVGAMPLDLDRAVATLDNWRAERRNEYVCVVSVHGLVVAQRDAVIRSALNGCGMATEDGMPLVWWSRLAGFSRARRVCGSDLLDATCAYGARADTDITFMEQLRRWSTNSSKNCKSVIPVFVWPAIDLPRSVLSRRRRTPPRLPLSTRRSLILFGWGLACPNRKNGWLNILVGSTRQR